MDEFLELNALNFFDYVETMRTLKGPMFFLHIPKTAGSSLVSDLSTARSPYLNLDHEYPESFQDFAKSKAMRLEQFSGMLSENAISSSSGHYTIEEIRPMISNHPDLIVFTFIRHPVQRLISEYNYCISDMHPLNLSFTKKYPSFEKFIRDPAEQNKMALYILGSKFRNDFDEKAVRRKLKQYTFIGLQERYPASFVFLSSCFWDKQVPRAKKLRVSKADNVHELTQKYSREILNTNRLDMFIYDTVSAVYDEITLKIWDI